MAAPSEPLGFGIVRFALSDWVVRGDAQVQSGSSVLQDLA